MENRRFTWVACGLVLGLASIALAAAAEVTVEELVRRWNAGTSNAELLRQVREHRGGFELDGDMVAELKAIGFPETVLRMMRVKNDARVRERVAGEEADNEARRLEGGLLRVRLNPDQQRSKKRRLRVNAKVDDRLIQQWELPRFADTHFTDIGVFVACGTPSHVPDGWRQKTPLDFKSDIMPRHRILALHTGASAGEKRKLGLGLGGANVYAGGGGGAATVSPDLEGQRSGMLVLELPPALEARLENDTDHEIHVGLALRVGETFYPWAVSAVHGVQVGDEPLELDAVVQGLANPAVDAIDLEFGDGAQRRFRTVRVCRKGCPVR